MISFSKIQNIDNITNFPYLCVMQTLNFNTYIHKIRQNKNGDEIFDFVRKKYVALTPEEWVRQHVLNFLVHEKNYPASLIAVEQSIKYNKLNKRIDVCVYHNNGFPYIITECKAPAISITPQVFQQAAMYNSQIKAKYLMLTNGLTHFYCEIVYTTPQIIMLKDLPACDFITQKI